LTDGARRPGKFRSGQRALGVRRRPNSTSARAGSFSIRLEVRIRVRTPLPGGEDLDGKAQLGQPCFGGIPSHYPESLGTPMSAMCHRSNIVFEVKFEVRCSPLPRGCCPPQSSEEHPDCTPRARGGRVSGNRPLTERYVVWSWDHHHDLSRYVPSVRGTALSRRGNHENIAFADRAFWHDRNRRHRFKSKCKRDGTDQRCPCAQNRTDGCR
jgi:hypothetical protein